METEQFSLCWNNFQNNLTAGFQALFKDEDLVDVTLAAEGRYIKAHKAVLSVCSPYFKELFRNNPCKHPIVILHDINYEALTNLLQFMYQGEVNVSQEEIPNFMRVAEILKVKGLTDNSNLNNEDNKNGLQETINNQHISQPFVGVADKQPIMKRTRPIKKMIKPIQHLKPLEFPNSSNSPSPSPKSPLCKQPRLDDTVENKIGPANPPLLKPKQEPFDPDENPYNDHHSSDDKMDMSNMTDTSLGESSDHSRDYKPTMTDTSSPGTIQCIMGKRGLPRIIIDGHTFFKKSTYKSKCFWYCKTNRTLKCPAVCWTINGSIVKWPEDHNHEIVPEIIHPEEDTVVAIENLRQVLMDAAR
ncbi:PREDICTED: protein bric-a-brac 1-like isoform X1 [Nicrophorus vespilloides]|uniref:Protein bric-a-brac 1-like isoform X1 n=1 Tax=Nicrophorus vespilloides TaxID=110193 RepID=A0ABM1N9F2_NICVS|nr:PREDICTED: protein bric-a-brac 1-like isoform X1 [Nicrophorus vespilloides]